MDLIEANDRSEQGHAPMVELLLQVVDQLLHPVEKDLPFLLRDGLDDILVVLSEEEEAIRPAAFIGRESIAGYLVRLEDLFPVVLRLHGFNDFLLLDAVHLSDALEQLWVVASDLGLQVPIFHVLSFALFPERILLEQVELFRTLEAIDFSSMIQLGVQDLDFVHFAM